MNRRYVVLDRDGTIIVERNYLSKPEQIELLPGAAAGMRRLIAHGYRLLVVTNQSGIGRGYFDLAALDAIHERFRSMLAAEGVSVDGIYFCPHTPADACTCRKPETGMLLQAAADFGFRLADCVVVGDKPCDIDMGRAVGATTFLVRSGYGAQHEVEGTNADHVVDDLNSVADILTAS
jgi:D-glycero-D-manno-heptose 1,7-bisphosphate phosphatase